MDYSIIIPVFNREDLTRQCLATLSPTLAGAGDGEVIVVDNGSTPATAAVLAAFPWVKVIRNERNLGFAVACNQGARVATGTYVVHLNNDTKALDGWLARMLARFEEPDVGVVGAKLLFPDDTLQHAGVLLMPNRFGPEGFGPYHFLWRAPQDARGGLTSKDFEVVTGACLVTPRKLFLDLGGFDERYWNGYEDVDYCLGVRARGLRVVYEASAVLYHYESQSGVQRKRRLMHNIRLLGERWAETVEPDSNRYAHLVGFVRREDYVDGIRTAIGRALPETTVIVHGEAPLDPEAFVAILRSEQPKCRILWLASGRVPKGVERSTQSIFDAISNASVIRGDRYLAFISTGTTPSPTWLGELLNGVEFSRDIVAASMLHAGADLKWSPVSADAQCTLIALRMIPQHVRIDVSFGSVDAMVCDWMLRAVELGRSIRRVALGNTRLGAAAENRAFSERHGMTIAEACRPNPLRLEEVSRTPAPSMQIASIIMLSWNAPEYTEIAVRSIREHTTVPYEIIIVDNGSQAATIERLKRLSDVHIIYNDRNMGFAHGCNQGIAAASGTHLVLLNNDVIVTDGWLEALLDAHRRIPTIGISAPRSNYVAGHQQVFNAQYPSVEQMHVFAAERALRFRRRLYFTDRVIGFCLCISREVINEVGGIDTRYPVGNFEDDDYCLRVRAAGYEIAVCEDSFIHHFGNASFKANNVDYGSQLEKNWRIFSERWSLSGPYPANGYDPTRAIAQGFRWESDYFALPGPALQMNEIDIDRTYDVAFLLVVSNESDWSRVSPFISNYFKTFGAEDRVLVAIAAVDTFRAELLGGRMERLLERSGLSSDRAPDVDVCDVVSIEAWRATIKASQLYTFASAHALPDIEVVPERSPSALRRILTAAVKSS